MVLAARAPPAVGLALVVAPLVATPVRRAEALLLPAADLGPVAAAVAFAAFVLVLAVCEAALPLLVAIAKPISLACTVASRFRRRGFSSLSHVLPRVLAGRRRPIELPPSSSAPWSSDARWREYVLARYGW